ncbi:MAG: hypothetical protein AAF561_04700 [Planctomycetota bacterium]
MRKTTLLTASAILTVPAAMAAAQVPTVIYSNLPGEPTNQIPGLSSGWDPDFGFFTLNASPSGEFWLLNFQSDDDTPIEVLVAGSGTTGTVVLEEFTPLLSTGRNVSGIDSSGRINDSGQWAIGGDLDDDSSTDDFIISGDLSGPVAIIAQEGQTIPAAFGFDPGDTFDTLDSTAIDAAGNVYFNSSGLDGPTFSTGNDDVFFVSNNTTLLRAGVDVPTNQSGGTTEAYDGFDLDDFHVSADGSSFLVRADLEGSTADDDALFVDGAVVIQENRTLSDAGIVGADALTAVVDSGFGGIDQQFMAGNGDWYAFGQVFDGNDTDWAVRNGEIIAVSGDSITPGSSETWDDPNGGIQDFSFLKGNANGDYVLAGLTSAGDVVAVVNGTDVVLRTGDELDLDFDGVGDGVFLLDFEFNEAALGDNNVLYALATFADANGAEIGGGFISVIVPEPTSLSLLACTTLLLTRRRRAC